MTLHQFETKYSVPGNQLINKLFNEDVSIDANTIDHQLTISGNGQK